MVLLVLVLTLPLLVANAALLGYVLMRMRRTPLFTLLLTLPVIGMAGCVGLLLPADLLLLDRIGGGFLLLTACIAALTVFGTITFKDLRQPRFALYWQMGGGVWFAALTVLTLMDGLTLGGAAPLSRIAAGDVAALVGWVLMGAALIVVVLRLSLKASLPEISNRMLYWLILGGLMLTAGALMASGLTLPRVGGAVLMLAMSVGVVVTFSSHRMFNIRGGLRRGLIAAGVIAFSGAAIFTALYFVNGWELESTLDKLVLFSVIGVGLGALFVPLWIAIEWALGQIFPTRQLDPARVTRDFSLQVSQAVDLKEIVTAATQSLNDIMGVQRSGIMLINSGDIDGEVELIAMQGGSFGDNAARLTLNMRLESPLYHRLANEQRPLSQYDLEYDPRFANLPTGERSFLKKLSMHAFAPIVMDSVMIGLLVCGPKRDDSVYSRRDLTVLATMAQQIGFALRNARLVADLRHLNTSMRQLNRTLENTNKELAQLDNVKTDFVTIASHELRTPLAQIRGYTDMIDAINETGMLEQSQVSTMVGNLRKAAERMEELIAAMLDVSQIDVNAMDLRFTDTTPETILKMAIEPLTNEIKQRKLNLTARWKGLPAIEADLQRLVQAFRNIVVNAIKFTPDGGHIEIVAVHQPAEKAGEVDHVLVSVSDTGVGINKEHLQLIFRKFYRTFDPALHSTGTYKFLGAGPGLGLTIAKGVIEAHGGRIWAESEYHSVEDCPGTTFYVQLPLRQQKAEKRVLIFDNEATNPKGI